jgi:hypothetical protein
VSYTVIPNTGAARTGTMTIGGKVFTITQAGTGPTVGGPCVVTLSTTVASFAAAGGTGTVSVQAPAGCAWQADSGASWIWSAQPTSGSGNGTYGYTVIPNTTGASRTGVVIIGGVTLTIQQAAH